MQPDIPPLTRSLASGLALPMLLALLVLLALLGSASSAGAAQPRTYDTLDPRTIDDASDLDELADEVAGHVLEALAPVQTTQHIQVTVPANWPYGSIWQDLLVGRLRERGLSATADPVPDGLILEQTVSPASPLANPSQGRLDYSRKAGPDWSASRDLESHRDLLLTMDLHDQSLSFLRENELLRIRLRHWAEFGAAPAPIEAKPRFIEYIQDNQPLSKTVSRGIK